MSIVPVELLPDELASDGCDREIEQPEIRNRGQRPLPQEYSCKAPTPKIRRLPAWPETALYQSLRG
jgi:hypothetical protein